MKSQGFLSKWALWFTMALLLGTVIFLSACSPAEPPATPTTVPATTAAVVLPTPECPDCPKVECPAAIPGGDNVI